MKTTAPPANLDLPYQSAIRLVLHSVSYSNALPDWFEAPGMINYSARQRTIRQQMQAYLQQTRPQAPFEIALPRRSGEAKYWSVPSINDQIICQVCVSSLAEPLVEKCLDSQRVFSYRYIKDSPLLVLTEDPLSSWRAFQRETQHRCSSGDCVLQIDLQEAFRSISRPKLILFLRNLFPNRPEVDILAALLDSFAAGRPGLPLVNDSIFFLGNIYLTVVDEVIARHTKNYIRFVDDYRIFSASTAQLESIQQVASPALEQLGFHINTHKLRLTTGEEYLESLSRIKYAQTEADGSKPDEVAQMGYAPLATFYTGLIPADAMVTQIKSTLERPEDNLNEGRGRLLMGYLRRARADAQVVEGFGDGDNGMPALRRRFVEQLSQDDILVARIIELLNHYAGVADETWRLTWLLYLSKDIDPNRLSKRMSARLQNTLAQIRRSPSLPALVKLWAAVNGDLQPTAAQIETIHEHPYLESGQLFLEMSKHG